MNRCESGSGGWLGNDARPGSRLQIAKGDCTGLQWINAYGSKLAQDVAEIVSQGEENERCD